MLITATVGVARLQLPVDNQWLYFSQHSEFPYQYTLIRMLPDGSSTQTILISSNFIEFEDWSPDSKWMILSEVGLDNRQLHRINLSGSHTEPLSDSDSYSIFCGWTPDSERIMYERITSTGQDIMWVQDDGRNTERIVANAWGCGDLARRWSPNDKWLIISKPDGLFKMAQDGTVAPLVNTIHTDIDMFFSWSPDSEWVYFSSQKRLAQGAALYRVRVDGTQLEELVRSSSKYEYEGHSWELRWTPDNQYLLILINIDGHINLYRMRPDGTGLIQLTHENGLERFRSWTPYGTMLIEHIRIDLHSLFEINLDGSGKRNISKGFAEDVFFTSWIPDDKGLIILSDHQLFRSKLDKIDWKPITNKSKLPFDDRFHMWSPDNIWMYYSSSSGLYRMSADGQHIRQLSKKNSLAFVTRSASIELPARPTMTTITAIFLIFISWIVKSLHTRLTISHHHNHT